jgi:hypothetical protein
MQRRTLLRYAGAGALSVGVLAGATGTALAGEFDVDFEVEDRRTDPDDAEERVDVDCGTPTTVRGLIVGEKSCHTAKLADYGREDGELSLYVETVADSDDCTHERVAIEYSVEVSDLDHRPDGVCVYHDGDRVARVDCEDHPDEDGKGDDEKDETDDDHDEDDDHDDDRRKFEFDVDDEEPEFDFDVDEEEPEFDFDIDEEEPEFDFDVDEEEPEFDFDIKEEPEFSFDIPEEPEFSFDIPEEPEFSFDVD